ncbi:serine hydrolase domain-containing protein [Solimonas soli]|uniref:serine hydrolase domain-containing protein n=1 Tax=Solimonas soli TaxID=413479 RepID=UPI00048959D2|nr:serine hydrolase domain-containing protein [Solimonas soli]
MRLKTLLPLACASALSLCACGGGDHAGDPAASYDWTALSQTLDSYIGSGDGQVTGYSFAMNVGGETVYTRAGGDLTTDAVVPIASASKAPAATVILTLVDDGLIALDTPVSKYIGSSIDWPVLKGDITMRMLLNHTSGLPFDSECMNDDNTTLQDCAQEIAHKALNFRPGEKFGYSGAGYQVAGYIAEKVSGKSWQQLVQERLSGPLGMTSFSYGSGSNPRIAGGAVSSAADYLKFTQLWLDGGKLGKTQILTANDIALGKTDQITGLPVYYTPVPQGSALNGYSFGWWLTDSDAIGGSAGPELSDPGLLGTTPWMDYDQRYTAALLLTSTTDIGIAMWHAARTDILAQLNPAMPMP